jgi:drug/metabolite transporter (DMT)-like permease
MGWIFLLLVIVGYIAMNFIMKLGSLKGHGSPALTGSLFATAALYCLIVVLISGKPLLVSPKLVLLAIAGGSCGAIAYFLFLSALKIGNYALTISIYTMSFLIPVIFSIVFWKRPLGTLLAGGILFILVGITMISWAGSARKERKAGLWPKWIAFLGGAFVLTSVPQIVQAAAVRMGAINLWFFLFLTFTSGAVFFALYFALTRMKLAWRVFSFGALAAAGSVAGNLFSMKALSLLPETIVFPMSLAGPIIGAVLLSLLFFREKIKPLGYAGIIIGLGGMILLTLK